MDRRTGNRTYRDIRVRHGCRVLFFLAVFAAAVLQIGGCGVPGGSSKEASRDIFAMDTFMTVTCRGERCEEALDAAEAEIMRLDELLSVGNPESEISRLNASGSAVLSADSAAMVEEAFAVCESSGGCFDITVYPLMELWGFTLQEYRVPEEDEIKQTLEYVGSGKTVYDKATKELKLEEGQGIDLGGIAKGYCSDRLMEIFDEYELDGALVSLGGNVVCYKTKPDGSLWKCGVRNPFDPDSNTDLAGVVAVSDCSVITSGAYERFFTGEDNKMYHHILDPHTGYPADSSLASVTIVSENGTLADALSTACYVMDFEAACDYWREYGSGFDMILVTQDGGVYITEPLQERFTSDKQVSVIRKGK